MVVTVLGVVPGLMVVTCVGCCTWVNGSDCVMGTCAWVNGIDCVKGCCKPGLYSTDCHWVYVLGC